MMIFGTHYLVIRILIAALLFDTNQTNHLPPGLPAGVCHAGYVANFSSAYVCMLVNPVTYPPIEMDRHLWLTCLQCHHKAYSPNPRRVEVLIQENMFTPKHYILGGEGTRF